MNNSTMNATFDLETASMQTSENAYLYFLDITFAISFPLHILILTMAFFYTPTEMFCYKVTVSNTTFWSTLVLFWQCLILRPFILFPFSVGISFGSRAWIKDSDDAQFHFQVLIIFVINMLTAMVICFFSLCLYLIQSPFMELMKRHWALSIGFLTHTSSTLFGLYLLNRLYNNSQPNQLRNAIIDGKVPQSYDSSMHQFLVSRVRQTDGVVFGFVPGENAPLISLLTWTCFSATVVIVLICLALVMGEIFKVINKTRSWRFKRNVFFMLSSRTMVPLIFGFLPMILLTFLVWKDDPRLLLIGNALFGISCSQAMINCVSTICVFRPYRRTFLRIVTSFLPCVPEDTRRRLYQSTTTFVTKGALTTVSSHWSRHATSAHFNARVAPFNPRTSDRRNGLYEHQERQRRCEAELY